MDEWGIRFQTGLRLIYGIKIHEVAHNVMQKVAYVLEHNAGIKIAQVNVNVEGVKVLGEK